MESHRAASYGQKWANEFAGGADVHAEFAYKMAAYTLIRVQKIAAQPRGEGLFIAKGGGEKIRAPQKN